VAEHWGEALSSERYALSMEEIDIREERCVQVEVPIGGKRRRPIDGCIVVTPPVAQASW